MPPFLAGREPEKSVFRRSLDSLRAKRPCQGDIILYGPRGNGKTVLLKWAVREAQARNLCKIEFYGSAVQSREDLAGQLSLAPDWLRRLRGMSVGGASVTMGTMPARRVARVLQRRLRLGPLLIAVDEAHRLGIEGGTDLLNTVQMLQSSGAAVMLMLAGTPDLPRHLNSMGATFWDRGQQLPVGRLQADSAGDAVRIPLEEHGRSIEDSALAQVVSESHGYPFFLQLWGDLLWETSGQAAPHVRLGDLERAKIQFALNREQYYLTRWRELGKAKLAQVAAAVAAEFAGADRKLPEPVEQAVRRSLERSGRAADEGTVLETCDRLHDLGYIWTVNHGGRPHYEAGIPSLMGYVARASGSTAEPASL